MPEGAPAATPGPRARALAAARGALLLGALLGVLHGVWLLCAVFRMPHPRGLLELSLASVGAYFGLAILLAPLAALFTVLCPGFTHVALARTPRALATLAALVVLELGGGHTLATWADSHDPTLTRESVALVLVLAVAAALLVRLLAARWPASTSVLRGAHALAWLTPGVLAVVLPASLLAHDGALVLLAAAGLLPLAPRVGARVGPRLRWIGVGMGVLALAWTLFGEREAPRTSAAVLTRHEPLRVLVALVSPLGDLDGDGASALFGASDCAPFDPFVGPNAAEIAGNGIDDNCLLGDLADDTLPPLPPFGPAWLQDADLLILSVDALRPDRMSMFGYPRATTPNIDRHFADAYRFHDAYAEAASTRDTLPSLLSGRRLLDLRWQVDDAVVLDPGNRFLGDHLTAYHAGGILPFTAVNMLGSSRLGLGAPIIYDDHNGRGSTASRVTATLLNLHKRLPAPRLLFAHYYEPHEPHISHRGVSEVSPDLYDQEVAHADRGIGELLDTLAESGALGRTIVVLTADHGEAFNEHGHRFHNAHVFDEDLRVPLLIRVPGHPGGDIHGPVSNSQLAATLLELIGAPVPASQGPTLPSLVPRMRGEPPTGPDVVASARALSTPGKWMLRRGDTKVILDMEAGSELAFDLAADPGETRPLVLPRALIDGFRERELGAARSRALAALRVETPGPEHARTPLVAGLALIDVRAERVDRLTVHPRLPIRVLVRLRLELGDERPATFRYRVELRRHDAVLASVDEPIAGGRASLRSWPAGTTLEDVRTFKVRREQQDAEIFVQIGAQTLALGRVDAQPVAP